MLSVVAFLCATALSPAECGRDTAIHVIPLGEVSSPAMCGIAPQMTLAGTALEAGDGYRWVIRCVETSIGERVG